MSIRPCIQSQIPWDLFPLRIAIIGEAPGAEEEHTGVPFVGPSGEVLNGWLRMKEIDRDKVFISNVFWSRPKDNEVGRYFARFKDDEATKRKSVPRYKGKCVLEELVPQLRKLREELKAYEPRVILALGSVAMWATTGEGDNITKKIGQHTPGKFLGDGFTVIPVLHPSYLIRTGQSMYVSECFAAVEAAKRIALKEPA